jgi:hypothetical protein
VSKFRLNLLALLGFFSVALVLGFGPTQGYSSKTISQATPSPSLGYDPRMLIKEFQEAQQNQLKTLIAREKAGTKELKNAQSAKQKEFDLREKEARRKFFAEDHPGAEKRIYMKGLLGRRDEFRKQLTDERNRAKQESDNRTRALIDEQHANLEKFKEALNQGKRPDDKLWPQPSL